MKRPRQHWPAGDPHDDWKATGKELIDLYTERDKRNDAATDEMLPGKKRSTSIRPILIGRYESKR